MEVWRWFKAPKHQEEKLGVEKVITGQEFKIFDGPKHVSQIYENLGA